MSSEELTKEESVRIIAGIFPNETRKQIIRLLLGDNESMMMYHNEICEKLAGHSKSTVHRHLIEMEMLGILDSKPDFKSSSDKKLVVFYSINKKYLNVIRRYEELL